MRQLAMKEVQVSFPTTYGDMVHLLRKRVDLSDIINLSGNFLIQLCCWLNKTSNSLLSYLMNNSNT